MGDIKIRNIVFFNVLCIFFMACLPQIAWASGVEVKAVPGLGGLYKMGRPVEMGISVNNDGPSIEGRIKIVAREINNNPVRNQPVYSKKVEIAANTNYKTTMLISGELAALNPNVELWVENKLLGVTKLQGTVTKGGAVALTLGEKILQGGFVTWAEKTYGSNLTVKYLPPRDLPNTYFSLVSADIIIVDQASETLLEDEQAKTIKEWVKLGGCLILSAEVGVEPGGIFKEFNLLSSDNSTANIATEKVGRGIVIHSKSNLGNVPAENKEFWQDFIKQLQGPRGNDIEERMRFLEEGIHGGGLTHTSSYLPQLKFPSVPVLAVFWLIYLFTVGPLTYIILKRLDRRDWAWVVIPVCAVIAAIGVFLTSPSQKLSAPFGQTLTQVEILDKHLSEVRGAGSFITVKGGSVKVISPPDALVVPVNNYRMQSDTPVEVDLSQDHQTITFSDVEYWSMRQSTLYTLRNDFGGLEGNLHLEDGRVVGTIKNNTKMNLRDCRIQVAQRLIDIGKLPIGETREISERLEKWPLMNRWGGTRNKYRVNQLENEEGTEIREERMLANLPSYWQKGTTQIEFVGWSDNTTSLFKINNVEEPQSQADLTLVRQFLRLNLPTNGIVKLPPGIIPAHVIEGGFVEKTDGLMISKGEVTFEYNMLELFNVGEFSLQTVEISGLSEIARHYNIQIFNWKENIWEEMTHDKHVLTGENLSSHLSPGKLLRIKLLQGVNESSTPVLPPALAVKGVVVQ